MTPDPQLGKLESINTSVYLTEYNHYILFSFSRQDLDEHHHSVLFWAPLQAHLWYSLILKPSSQSYLDNLFFFQASGILLISISGLERLSHLFWQHDQPKSVIFSKSHWKRDLALVCCFRAGSSLHITFLKKKNLLIQSWLKAHNVPFLLLLNRVSYSHVVAVQLKQWGLHPVLDCEFMASNLGWLGYLRAEFWLTLYVKVLFWHHLHTAGLRSSQNGNEKKEALLFEAVLFEWPRVCDLKLEKLEGQSRLFSCSQ